MNDTYSNYHNAHEKFKGDAPNLEDSYMALHTTTWYTHTALVSDRLPLFPAAKTVLLPVRPSSVLAVAPETRTQKSWRVF